MKKLYDDEGQLLDNAESEDLFSFITEKVQEMVEETQRLGYLERHVEGMALSIVGYEFLCGQRRRFRKEEEQK